LSDRTLQPPLHRPLTGRHILVTQAEEPTTTGEPKNSLMEHLEQWGAKVDWLPLVEIQPVSVNLPDDLQFDWLFFTSKNAARAFLPILKQRSDFSPSKHPLPFRIAVVGPATGHCVESLGYAVDFISPQADARSAANAFCRQASCKGLQIIWPCGNLANADLQDLLQNAGAQVKSWVVYETHLRMELTQKQEQILRTSLDMLVFTSPSAIDAWELITNRMDEQTRLELSTAGVACLGPRTAQAAMLKLGRADVQAKVHTLDGLAQAICTYFTEGFTEGNNLI
jgi:uroporphyrinogen III methyltransferase/synthase